MEEKKKISSETIRDYLMITLGTLLLILGNHVFKFPNHFSFGGVAGISIIVNGLTGIHTSTINLVLNVLLLIISFFVLGKDFGVKSIYASLLFTFGLSIADALFPMEKPITDQPMLELIFAIAVPAVGSAILFNRNSSSGGTDIIALILKKYSKADLGTALFFADALVAVISFLVYDVKTGLYSVVGLVTKSLVIDSVIEVINRSKFFTIVTDNPEPILDYIEHTLAKGATVYKAEGAYTGQEKTVIMTVTRKNQAVDLRNFIKLAAPSSFITITTTSEIIGKGFKGVD